MKKLFIIPIISLFLFCGTKSHKNCGSKHPITEKNPQSYCPGNGVCETKIFKNQSLEVKTDEFGSVYYEKTENRNTSVVLFSYTKNIPKDLQDAGYREEIVFEINNSDSALELSDLNLQNTKMLFGRFCFCKGQTGYYKVKSGNLELRQADKKIAFNLNFTVSEVPQIIKSVKETIK